MSAIFTILGLTGAAIGIAIGVLGAFVGAGLGLLGGALGLLVPLSPVLLIVLGVIWLVKSSSRPV